MRIIPRYLFVAILVTVAHLATAQPASDRPVFFGPGLSSEELAKLPQTPGAKGDQHRHYYFKDAGREMPYHLYVPQNYDPKVGAPLVVALHGYSVNQEFFPALVKNLSALCDQYGFIFVAPMGYSVSGWYGAPMSIPGAPPEQPANEPKREFPPPQTGTPAEQLRERQLSEQDVLNVIDLVNKEYTITPGRTYLMGHSMGGFGTWYLGDKYIDRWAAIAPMSGINQVLKIDVSKLAKIPVLVSVGEKETMTVVASKKAVAALQQAGGVAAYVEIPGGTHVSMVPDATAQILKFFSQH